MENKRWSFKVPGEPDGRERIMNSSEIKSVYDLLDMLRSRETQHPQTEQTAQLTSRPKAVLIPFVSRMPEKRRHPSA